MSESVSRGFAEVEHWTYEVESPFRPPADIAALATRTEADESESQLEEVQRADLQLEQQEAAGGRSAVAEDPAYEWEYRWMADLHELGNAEDSPYGEIELLEEEAPPDQAPPHEEPPLEVAPPEEEAPPEAGEPFITEERSPSDEQEQLEEEERREAEELEALTEEEPPEDEEPPEADEPFLGEDEEPPEADEPFLAAGTEDPAALEPGLAELHLVRPAAALALAVRPKCYKILSTTARPASIGFEFDLSYGASTTCPPLKPDRDPVTGLAWQASVYGLEHKNITTHRMKKDGFRLEGDGNRIEIATKPFELNPAGRREMQAVMKAVLDLVTSYQRQCGLWRPKAADRALGFPSAVGPPGTSRPPSSRRGLAASFPSRSIPRSPTTGTAAAWRPPPRPRSRSHWPRSAPSSRRSRKASATASPAARGPAPRATARAIAATRSTTRTRR